MLFLIVFLLLVLIIPFTLIKVVKQSEVYVIERFGKFHKIADAGLTIIIPFFEEYLIIFYEPAQATNMQMCNMACYTSLYFKLHTDTELPIGNDFIFSIGYLLLSISTNNCVNRQMK